MYFFFFFFFDRNSYFIANSVDPDQSPHSVASDLGLRCLPRSLKRAARLIWVKVKAQMSEKCLTS